MKDLLLIAFLFPPRASIGGKRPLRLARHLPAHGWRPVVLAGSEGVAGERDDSLLASVPADLEVIRDYSPGWMSAIRDLGQRLDERLRPKTGPRNRDGKADASPGRLAGLVEGLGDKLVPMDGDVAFAPHAFAAALRLVRARRPRAVYVSAYPYSALVVGAALKRATGVPFVAELRDPWTFNVQFAARHPAVAALERRLERLVFATADRVVVTTEAVREEYARLYPGAAGRIRCVYSPYDESMAPAAAPAPAPAPVTPATPLRVVHFGSLYGPRCAEALLHAMARLRDERGLAPGALALTVFGRMDAPEDHAAIAALGLAAEVSVRERIPYAEGIAALRAADVLFLPTFGASTHYIPGKFYDYLLAGRPILCEGVGEELPGIIARTGTGATVAPGDVAGMAAFLGGVLDARLAGREALRPVPAEIERFSAPATAGEIAALLDEIAG